MQGKTYEEKTDSNVGILVLAGIDNNSCIANALGCTELQSTNLRRASFLVLPVSIMWSNLLKNVKIILQ